MVVKPQKTKFQVKVVNNLETLSSWATNFEIFLEASFLMIELTRCLVHE